MFFWRSYFTFHFSRLLFCSRRHRKAKYPRPLNHFQATLNYPYLSINNIHLFKFISSKHLFVGLIFTLFALPAFAITEIGAPKNFKPRPKGSEMVLISYKLVECFTDKKIAEKALDNVSVLTKHKACGNGFAHVLMVDNISMLAGEDKTMTNDIQIPYLVHEPMIYVEKGLFKVKPKMNKQTMQVRESIVISLSKIIQGHIKATISATVQNVQMQDLTAYYKDDQTYVHQKPIRYTRVMTGEKTLKLDESSIISGDMWVEGFEKENDILPEHSRLWLELLIK